MLFIVFESILAKWVGCFSLIALLYLYVLLRLSVYVFTTAESRVKIWSVNLFTPPVASAFVHTQLVVLLLIIYFMFCSHCLWGLFVLRPCFVLQYFVSFLVLQLSGQEERAGCYSFVVF